MSDYNNHSSVSERFREALSNGLASGNFSELNTLVTETVTDTLSNVEKQVRDSLDRTYMSGDKSSYTYTRNPKNAENSNSNDRSDDVYYQKGKRLNTTLPAVKVKKVGHVSSVLCMVFGGMGTAVFSLIALIFFAVSFKYSQFVPLCISFGIVDIISMLVLRTGILQRQRLGRVKRYIALCADKMYINIADLAQHIGKGRRFIVKDVKKMIEVGIFPEGHLDSKESCLMLDDKTYNEYLQLEKQRKLLEKNGVVPSVAGRVVSTEALDKMASARKEKEAVSSMEQENPQLYAMISEGREYIQKLNELNDLIPEESISDKMYRMGSLLKEIFTRLEEKPEEMPKMQKLMNYYLPTTIKLLQAYSEIDDVSAPGTDIVSAKAEIEKTVDTINEAFEELLNKLFQATVFDATTDAQVLQTMLAKEGLVKNDFSEDEK